MEKLKELINKINEQGIIIPYLRDPVSKQPSVSLTAFSISLCVVLFGLFNKVVQIVKGFDMTSALQLLEMTSYLYFGRSLTKFFESKNKEEKK